MTYGIAFALMVVAGSVWMRFPPKGWSPAGFQPTTPAAVKGSEDFTGAEMFRTPQFYLVFAALAVSAGGA